MNMCKRTLCVFFQMLGIIIDGPNSSKAQQNEINKECIYWLVSTVQHQSCLLSIKGIQKGARAFWRIGAHRDVTWSPIRTMWEHREIAKRITQKVTDFNNVWAPLINPLMNTYIKKWKYVRVRFPACIPGISLAPQRIDTNTIIIQRTESNTLSVSEMALSKVLSMWKFLCVLTSISLNSFTILQWWLTQH